MWIIPNYRSIVFSLMLLMCMINHLFQNWVCIISKWKSLNWYLHISFLCFNKYKTIFCLSLYFFFLKWTSGYFSFLFIYLFFWLCWVFVSVQGLSPVVASGGHSSSRCAGLSLSWPLLLWSTGSRRAGSVTVAHGPSRSEACGILPDQGSNPCPLHWQADSQPLRHQGSPIIVFLDMCCHFHIIRNFAFNI